MMTRMRPLSGVRVIEAAGYVSGPFAGLALADLGADVLKVEPPRGDPHRRFGPQAPDGGVMFRATNRNKRSISLDLTTTDGMAAFARELETADVLISNWRPGVAEKFGLTADFVRSRWPRLVWVRVSGYGQDGPMADLPSFDSIVQARVGISAAMGEPPMLLPFYLADKTAAMFAAQSALAALVQRGVTGEGALVDVAMVDALAYFDVPDRFAAHQRPGEYDARVDRMLGAPRPLPTADSWVVLAPVSGQQIKRALVAAGLEAAMAELKAQPDAVAASQRFFELFGDHLRSRTTAEWLAVFADADVPASAVMGKAEHLADEQVAHQAMYRIADEPGVGPVRRVRHPALFDGAPVDTDDLPSPPLGD
jgi:crotonobetainyl-CoA:carnitine CoA-transferase CaiB-like acyl-CoA transferase